MKLESIARELHLTDLTPALAGAATAEVTAGYASDLLSDVLANAPEGGVLVTLQVHLNVVAVASHAELSAVIFTSGRAPDPEIVAKAMAEDLHLYATDADTFETVGRLFALGVKSGRDV
jgi:DRTGG domain